jgi:predicted alpha/beta hydrolase
MVYPAVEPAQVRLCALDGFELGGILYAPPGTEHTKRAAVLHGGAGIRAQSYASFAKFLAQAGIPVLLYDYRGIGLSRPAGLRGFRATIEDWAEYDCAGAIAWLRRRFSNAAVLGIAHSIGTLLVGGAANAAEQNALLLIGAHTAYYGDYRRRYRLPMTLVWHALMPLVTRTVGYFPAQRLRLGQDLPAQIALQWASRLSPGLDAGSSDSARERRLRLLERCAALERPAVVLSVSDDAFATAAGTRRLLSYYPRLSALRHVLFTPADAGTRHLGHFGVFRSRAGRILWPRLWGLMETLCKQA